MAFVNIIDGFHHQYCKMCTLNMDNIHTADLVCCKQLVMIISFSIHVSLNYLVSFPSALITKDRGLFELLRQFERSQLRPDNLVVTPSNYRPI